MTTLLVLGHSETGDRRTKKVLVSDSFEEVLDKVCPITPATSSLENRKSMVFTRPDGRSTFANSPIIRVVENVTSIDDDEDD